MDEQSLHTAAARRYEFWSQEQKLKLAIGAQGIVVQPGQGPDVSVDDDAFNIGDRRSPVRVLTAERWHQMPPGRPPQRMQSAILAVAGSQPTQESRGARGKEADCTRPTLAMETDRWSRWHPGHTNPRNR